MLSNTCKYAVRALIYLGKYSVDGTKIGIKKISSDLIIPTPFLGKILQNLVKQKVLVSTKGPNGGLAWQGRLTKFLCTILLGLLMEMIFSKFA